MDVTLIDIISRFGIGGGFAYIFYLIIKELLKTKIENIRQEIEKKVKPLQDGYANLEAGFFKHISRHKENDQSLCGKIDRLYDRFDKVYDRLNSQAETLNQLKGYMRARNDNSP
jgi:septal ring factor EnvC (AmiA/AmiB activator)